MNKLLMHMAIMAVSMNTKTAAYNSHDKIHTINDYPKQNRKRGKLKKRSKRQ